jgi:DNA-binding transcriptional LysR family regulator
MANMTLRHIQTFLAVVDNECSITKAADFLHVAQPSVSQTIADMENHYNFQFFDRLNRKLYLTNEGKKLLPYARRAVDDFDTISAAMEHGEENVPLRIGASLTVGTAVLPRLLATMQCKKTHSESFCTTIMVQNTQFIEQAILESRIDLAIVEGDIFSSSILQTPIMHDTLIAVCAPEYSVSLQNIVWILREKGSGTRSLSETAFKVPSDTEKIWNISNTQTIIELVKAGLGITVISQILVKKELNDGTLCDCTQSYIRLSNKEAERTFRLIYHKDKLVDKRMEFFIKKCQTYFDAIK